MELQFLQALGLPGIVFLLAYGFAHIAIVEFCKSVLARLGRGVQGLAVIVLSLGLGAVLGALMLGTLAQALGLTLPPPFAGGVAGILLAVIASGYVAWQQRKAEARGVPTDALIEALGRAQPPVPVVVATPAPQVTVEVPATPQPLDFPTDDLRPMTPADVTHLGVDGPRS